MGRNWIRSFAGSVSFLLGVAGLALWRWKRARLEELAAGSELVTTDQGLIEVARQGSGFPVLVLHGDPGGYDQGLHVAETMFEDDFEIIAPSRPGYLRTPLDDNRSFGDQAALFVALLDELGIEQALVVGLSGGGPTALQLAAEYPERVSGLILGSAITTEFDERIFDTGNPVVDYVLTSTPILDVRSGLFALLHRFAPNYLIKAIHSEVSTLEGEELDKYVEFIRTTPEHRKQSLNVVQTLRPVSARIDGTLNDEHWFRRLPLVEYEAIDCPVLVVHGRFDAAVPLSQAEFVAQTLADVEFLRLDTDHLAWIGPDAERGGRKVREFAESVAETVDSTG
ncbi:alpha/beta fold hydrolase [Halomicrococcus sp. NG-SE-24]|uniref:alpha/beta fold hydrolase n=1 Tax=Halomicrococcus sp. NG-SE-24 TaxID=3436928 RepID=UPI003D979879